MRKYRYIALLLLLPALLTSCSKKESKEKILDVEAVSWPIFRGDPMLSGMAEDELLAELTLLWSFKTESWIISSPVMGFGRVYIGSSDGKVYSINLTDGSKVWEFDTGDDIEASPLLLDGAIYVGNLSGEFFSLDAHTGQVRWKYKCDNSIYGSANWVRNPKDQKPLILVGSYDNRIYCMDAATGKLNWSYETDNYINGAPATDGVHVVFGGCDELLHILSVLDGTKIGEVWAGSYIPGSVSLVENRAYLGHYDNKLVCIDTEEKKIVWEYEDKDHPDAFFSSPAVGKDRVLIGSRDGYLHCVNRKNGEKIWAFQSRDDIDSSPVISGNKVVFGSMDGRLYVVNLKDGKEIWSYEIGAAIFGCPAVAGGFIVIGADDGRVYAFGEKS
jgi:outer membrane protein assembly factor BamB